MTVVSQSGISDAGSRDPYLNPCDQAFGLIFRDCCESRYREELSIWQAILIKIVGIIIRHRMQRKPYLPKQEMPDCYSRDAWQNYFRLSPQKERRPLYSKLV